MTTPTLYKLAPYDELAKHRAILQHVGDDRWVPVAWVDYDDVDHAEADATADAMLRALCQPEQKDEFVFTPKQDLVMEVLAARYRLGEPVWTFSSVHAKALTKLENVGLVGWKSGVVENTVRAWLTEEGKARVLSESYVPPPTRVAGGWYVACGCPHHGDHLGCEVSCKDYGGGCNHPLGVVLSALTEEDANARSGQPLSDA